MKKFILTIVILFSYAAFGAQYLKDLQLKDVTIAATPSNGYGRIGVESDRLIFTDDSNNKTDVLLSGVSSIDDLLDVDLTGIATGQVLKWDGSTLTASADLGTDHGLLTGLGDDDHTQYLLVDGSRNTTGDHVMDQDLTITATLFLTNPITVDVTPNYVLGLDGSNGIQLVPNSGGTPSPLTTDGDLYYYNSGEARLPIGTNGQMLIVSGGFPSWQDQPTTTGTLGEINTDVNIGTPNDDDVLTYLSGEWIAQAIPGTTTATLSAGSGILVTGGGDAILQNATVTLNATTGMLTDVNIGTPNANDLMQYIGGEWTAQAPAAATSGDMGVLPADVISISVNADILGKDATLSLTAASATSTGYLTAADWTTFNNKIDGVSFTATQFARYEEYSGVGSSADKIPYYNTNSQNEGSGLFTIANSSTNGLSVTMDTTAYCTGGISASQTSANQAIGISKNIVAAAVNSAFNAITSTDRLCISNTGAANDAISCSAPLNVFYTNDVIRPHFNESTGGTTNRHYFYWSCIKE